jgi:hypothetical protein
VNEGKNMTNQILNSAENPLSKINISSKEYSRKKSFTIWHIGAGVTLIGGTFALFFAIFLTIFQYFYGETSHGIWLYVIVLPLWIVGAHCLDKIEEKHKAARIEFCRKHGIKE